MNTPPFEPPIDISTGSHSQSEARHIKRWHGLVRHCDDGETLSLRVCTIENPKSGVYHLLRFLEGWHVFGELVDPSSRNGPIIARFELIPRNAPAGCSRVPLLPEDRGARDRTRHVINGVRSPEDVRRLCDNNWIRVSDLSRFQGIDKLLRSGRPLPPGVPDQGCRRSCPVASD